MFMIITLLHCYLTVAVIAASRNAAARIGRRRSRDTMLFKCEAGLDVGRVRVSRPGAHDQTIKKGHRLHPGAIA
jgi:hypothetical protein